MRIRGLAADVAVAAAWFVPFGGALGANTTSGRYKQCRDLCCLQGNNCGHFHSCFDRHGPLYTSLFETGLARSDGHVNYPDRGGPECQSQNGTGKQLRLSANASRSQPPVCYSYVVGNRTITGMQKDWHKPWNRIGSCRARYGFETSPGSNLFEPFPCESKPWANKSLCFDDEGFPLADCFTGCCQSCLGECEVDYAFETCSTVDECGPGNVNRTELARMVAGANGTGACTPPVVNCSTACWPPTPAAPSHPTSLELMPTQRMSGSPFFFSSSARAPGPLGSAGNTADNPSPAQPDVSGPDTGDGGAGGGSTGDDAAGQKQSPATGMIAGLVVLVLVLVVIAAVAAVFWSRRKRAAAEAAAVDEARGNTAGPESQKGVVPLTDNPLYKIPGSGSSSAGGAPATGAAAGPPQPGPTNVPLVGNPLYKDRGADPIPGPIGISMYSGYAAPSAAPGRPSRAPGDGYLQIGVIESALKSIAANGKAGGTGTSQTGADPVSIYSVPYESSADSVGDAYDTPVLLGVDGTTVNAKIEYAATAPRYKPAVAVTSNYSSPITAGAGSGRSVVASVVNQSVMFSYGAPEPAAV